MKKFQSFVLQNEEIFIGLEDSKKTWRLAVRSGNIVVAETAMEAKINALESYLKKQFPMCKIHLAYEAGFRGFWLHDRLVANGVDCIVVPPNRVHQEKSNTQKNDTRDARLLAEMAQFYPHKRCFIPSCKAREDREIIRLYLSVNNQIIAMKNRIRKKLVFHGFEEHFPDKTAWKDSDYANVVKTLANLHLSEALEFSFVNLCEQLKLLQERKKSILKKLIELSEKPEYLPMVEIMKSVPGIGPLVAIGFILELAGDMRRFPRRAKWGHFLGLAPRDFSSGEADHKGHISREGNPRIRAWLVEAAWIAIRKDPVLLKKYNAVVRSSGSGKKAIVAVAHKMALRCRALLISGQKYQKGVIEG